MHHEVMGEIDLTLSGEGLTIASLDGPTEDIRFGDIRKINIVPVRLETNWYDPPAIIVMTEDEYHRFAPIESTYLDLKRRKGRDAAVSNDRKYMAGIVHDLHGILVTKGYHNGIRFGIKGSFSKGLLFIYPIFAIPTVVAFQESKSLYVAIGIALGIYALLFLMTKTGTYNAQKIAKDKKYASFLLK